MVYVGAVEAEGARRRRLLAKATFVALPFSKAFALAVLAMLALAFSFHPVASLEEDPAQVFAGILDGLPSPSGTPGAGRPQSL